MTWKEDAEWEIDHQRRVAAWERQRADQRRQMTENVFLRMDLDVVDARMIQEFIASCRSRVLLGSAIHIKVMAPEELWPELQAVVIPGEHATVIVQEREYPHGPITVAVERIREDEV